jgi:hypothetical protein
VAFYLNLLFHVPWTFYYTAQKSNKQISQHGCAHQEHCAKILSYMWFKLKECDQSYLGLQYSLLSGNKFKLKRYSLTVHIV